MRALLCAVPRLSFGRARVIQATQELLTISLDNHRNRLIQLNVTLAMLSCGVAMSTTITSMFGMNLSSGLEHHPSAFFMVSDQASLAYARWVQRGAPQY